MEVYIAKAIVAGGVSSAKGWTEQGHIARSVGGIRENGYSGGKYNGTVLYMLVFKRRLAASAVLTYHHTTGVGTGGGGGGPAPPPPNI